MKRIFIIILLTLACASMCKAQVIITPVAGVATVDVGTCGQGGASPNPSCTFKLTLTANTTLAFNNVFGGATVNLFINPSTFTLTWPASVPLPPGLAASQNNAVSLRYDGTSGTWLLTSGGSIAPNNPLPASSSGPGPVFNVKNYGAHGDTQTSYSCTTSTLNLNCTDVTFTAANVGQRVSCSSGGSGLFGVAPTTFAAFVDAHNMTLAQSGGAFSATCMWGTPDDAAITAAVTAAVAQMCSRQSRGNVCISTAAPTIYFPAGAYNLLNATTINIAPATGSSSGFAIKGDGVDQSKVYWHEGTANAQGAAVQITGNVYFAKIQDITFDGAQQQDSFSNAALLLNGASTTVLDVRVQNFAGTTNGVRSQGTFNANRLGIISNNGDGLDCNPCNGEIHESIISNNGGFGILFQNVGGLTTGPGFRLVNSLLDENSPTAGCDVSVLNSIDIWFQGTPIFGSVGAATNKCALSIDGTSFVHWTGGLTGPFSSEFPKTGVTIAAGGVLQASDVRFVGAGTGNCIVNSGQFFDNGGNSCETVYAISSGTSTGTTAVLTLASNTVNVNTNCAVGDALIVEGANVNGYNGYYPAGTTTGITAVTATTLTYTTAGSNLGAAGGFGNAYCRNLTTYSGTLPKALLNNPIPNTCYITGTFAATTTAAPMCAFKLGSATNVSQIKATSTTTTACTVAPVVTITDGTISETLTITTGKSIWDSSVDASTGVGTSIFKPNGTITLSNTVGTCTTPPTNFSVSYNISPILSN